MTIVISDNNPRISYTATAGQTAFPTNFAFFDEGDINVYINDTLKTLNTDYTVTGGSGSDGTVTLTTGATAGDVIVLTRDVELERTTDFPSSGPFQVGSLNTELDKIIAMIADMEDLAERGLRLSDSDTSASLVLADKDSRKGTVLAFNSTTGAVEVGPTIADTQSIADIKADIAALADIEDGTVATDAISDLAAITSDVTTAASNITAIQNASTNATTASTKATEAAASATTASTKASEAATSATTATTKASEAATSATSAATSATTATTKASEASTSATNAATSATSASTAQTAAETAQTAAETAQTAAETAKTGAETAKTAAETAKTGAETAKTAAETAQTAAETAETNAATSETNASTSATTATTKASEASTSATNAATSETNAATSATNAATSATAAAASQTAAAASAASAASAYDSFDDRYLGVKTSDPTVDNDGNALVEGALYFNSTANEMRVYDGANWIAASSAGSVSLLNYNYTATSGQTTFSGADDNSNTLSYTVSNIIVTINGVTLEDGTDYTATNGTSVVLTDGANVDDELNIIAFKSFTTADMVSATNGGTFNGDLTVDADATVTGDLTVDTDTLYVDSTNDRVGIGTSSPTKDVHIKTTTTNNQIRVEASGGNLNVGNDSTGSFVESTGSRPFRNFVNGSERMRIDSNGRVGIGTTSPDSNLHLTDSSASTNTHVYTKLHIEDADHSAIQFSGSTGGEQWIWFADDTSSTPVGGITYYHGGEYMAMRVAGAERMRILPSGGITFNGDTAAANALDDYEEGTFTPALSTGTATFELANYIKVGALVTVSFVMSNFSNRTSTADVRVTGLPYSSISGGSFVSACLARYINSGGDSVVAYQAANDDKLYFYTVNQGSNYGSVDHDNLNSSNASFYVTHTYRTS